MSRNPEARSARLNACLVVFAVVGGTMLLFAGWHVASTLGLRNGWGDTGRYLRASQVFSMPTEREILYPLILRGVREALPRAMKFSGVQLLQLGAAFASAAYLAWSLWIAVSPRSNDGAAGAVPNPLSAPCSRYAILLVALLAVAEPVSNHFHMTILTDSFAGSLMMAAFAGMVAFAYDARRRTLHGGIACAAFLLVGILRPEKAFMNAAMFATIIGVWWVATRWKAWRTKTGEGVGGASWVRGLMRGEWPQPRTPWGAWATIGALILAVAIPVALVGKLVTPRNKGKYPSMYDARMLILTRVHLQSFGDIYKKLDRRTRIMFGNHDAGRIDRHRANLNMLIAARLRDHPQFRNPIVEDIIATTWREARGKVLRQFAFDAGSYLVPPAGFYLELALPRKEAKLADFSRHTRLMMMNHQSTRGIFPRWAVDAYLVTGAAWWVLLMGGSVVAMVFSPGARAAVRERLPVLGLFAVYHFWAIFSFLFLHNQFIVRYALPSYAVMLVALPTIIALALVPGAQPRAAGVELAGSHVRAGEPKTAVPSRLSTGVPA